MCARRLNCNCASTIPELFYFPCMSTRINLAPAFNISHNTIATRNLINYRGEIDSGSLTEATTAF